MDSVARDSGGTGEHTPKRIMDLPLLYRAALQGRFGKRTEFGLGSITDALFVGFAAETAYSVYWLPEK